MLTGKIEVCPWDDMFLFEGNTPVGYEGELQLSQFDLQDTHYRLAPAFSSWSGPLPSEISYNLLFQISQLHQIWSRWIEHDVYDDCISLSNFSIWIDKTFRYIYPLRISLTTFLSSHLRLILEGHG